MSFDMPISDIIRPEILQCPPHTPISEAAYRMNQAGCGSILVIESGEVTGIWTRHDALRVDLQDRAALDMPVSSVMSRPVATLAADTTIAGASLFFIQNDIRHALVVDEAGRPVGVLSQSDVVGLPSIELDVTLKKVGTLLSRSTAIIPATLALAKVVKEMTANHHDAVVVDFGVETGILTEHDVLGALSRKQTHVTAGEIATRPMISVSADTSLVRARALCAEKGIRHLGVTDAHGAVVGVLSQREVLASFERDYVDALQSALVDYKQRLAKSDQELLLARQVFDATGEGIMITDADGIIRTVNPAFCRITGYSREEVIGRTPGMLRSGRHPNSFYADMWAALKEHGHWEGEIWDRRKNGEVFPKLLSIRALTDENGEVNSHIGTFSDLSEQKRAELERKESEQRMREVMSVLGDGVMVIDDAGKLAYLNPAGEAMLGWRMEELVGRDAYATFHCRRPDGTPAPAEEWPVLCALGDGQMHRAAEDYFMRKDGSLLPVSTVASPVMKNEIVTGAVASFHDISDRIEAERSIRESEERYRALFNGSSDAVFVCLLTPEGLSRLVEVNEVACRRLGYSRQELLAMSADELDATGSLGDFPLIAEHVLDKGEAVFVTEHRAKNGHKMPVEVSVRAFELKGVRHALCIARDITERQAMEEELRRRAHYDSLTQLPNRAFLLELMTRALAKASRYRRHFALLFLDLDDFKQINDTHGHEAGDLVLKTASERMVSAVRACDIVSRIGGDEFVVVLTEIAGAQDAEAVAVKIAAAVNQPVRIGDAAFDLQTSIGIAVYPDHGEDISSLMRFADQAMYDSKAVRRAQRPE
ncbi:MAG TPA: PAS domain S-box protein [Noviherbaspirillum sp.]|nr:PAS domain S-box protein [Noviherbaspirillum sp.]